MRFIAIFLFLCAALAWAQESAQIRGTVVDARSGEPLARVQVQLAGTSYQTVTDSQGRFALAGVSAGEYALHVSTVGYRLQKKAFSLASGESKEFEVVLSPEAIRQTDSVEVKSGPFDLPRQDSPSELTLSASEAKNLANVLADDPLRAVQAMPGVTSNDDFDARFSLRGADYHRIGLYLDDILLHAPFHAVEGDTSSGSLTIFNGDMLDDIALHSGAYPSRYADRTAGVLDVHTREGDRSQIHVRGTAGAANAGVIAEGPLGKNHHGSWLAGARKSYLQYILQRTAPDQALAFGFTDFQGRLTYDIAPKHNLTLSIIDGFSNLDRTMATNLGINSVMLSNYHFTIANLAWRYTPNERFLITNRAAFMRERFDTQNRQRYDLDRGSYGEWIWNANASWVWSKQNPLDLGWSMRRLREDGFTNQYQFTPFAVRRLNDYRGTGVLAGGYLEQAWRAFAGRLILSTGFRFDRYTAADQQAVSPHASLTFVPHPTTRLQFGWGQYAQFAELNTLFARIGNPHLLPERANQLVASVEQKIGQLTRVRAEFYDRQDRDLLFRPFFDPRILAGKIFNPTLDTPIRNSQRGYARGMEIFVQRRTANRLTGWVSYTLGYARLRDGVAGVAFPSDVDQRHTANVYLGYRVRPTINLSTKWLYGSGFPIPGFFRLQGTQYYLAPDRNALRMPNYQRADVRINKACVFDRWKLTIYGEVVNLLNRGNRRYDVLDGYNSRTGLATLRFDKMFPILPSAGIVLEF